MTEHVTSPLDFRSDTVTRPTPDMRAAMAAAEVGDDYYRDDPTVHELEKTAATILGKEAALLTTSGTQSNLIAVLAQCGRGDAYVVGHRAHNHLRELGGVSVVAGVQPRVVPMQSDGRMALAEVEAALYPPSILFAPVRLIALENTQEGKVLPLKYIKAVAAIARRFDLRLHLDGARLFNAATALDVPVAEVARPFDTVSVCLSKGLGAPVGSILASDRATIEAARRHRQMLGGGMRQAGILAAAGLYALNHHVKRLTDDHARATLLAASLTNVAGLTVSPPETNIVFCDVDASVRSAFTEVLDRCGILSSGTPSRRRFVTHIDIGDAGIAAFRQAVSEFADRLGIE